MTNDQILGILRTYGADLDGVYRRFSGDMDCYLRCIALFQEEPNFSQLATAIHTEQYEQAYFFAHALKGAAGNLGLIPIYDFLTQLVNELNESQEEAVRKTYAELIHEMHNFCTLVVI